MKLTRCKCAKTNDSSLQFPESFSLSLNPCAYFPSHSVQVRVCSLRSSRRSASLIESFCSSIPQSQISDLRRIASTLWKGSRVSAFPSSTVELSCNRYDRVLMSLEFDLPREGPWLPSARITSQAEFNTALRMMDRALRNVS